MVFFTGRKKKEHCERFWCCGPEASWLVLGSGDFVHKPPGREVRRAGPALGEVHFLGR